MFPRASAVELRCQNLAIVLTKFTTACLVWAACTLIDIFSNSRYIWLKVKTSTFKYATYFRN